MKQLKNSPRFWSMLVSGFTMIVLVFWVAFIKLSNPAWKPSDITMWCIEILGAIFLFLGIEPWKIKKPSGKKPDNPE